jgi:hypothetical protein
MLASMPARFPSRAAAVFLTATAAAFGLQFVPASASASATAAKPDPRSPAYQHAYRRGVVPVLGRLEHLHTGAAARPGARPNSANNLSYGGGIDGIGVTTGPEKVYLVFFGSQWGTQGTDGNGNVTLTGDPAGTAPYLQQLFKGLGTGSETWSGVMTQYCDGVAFGAQTCPAANSEHVAYPSGGALAGVWVDKSAASPSQATGHQLGVEAVSAAAHFGNTTAAANRNAQYVILSPTGTHPDGFNTPNGGFCAWHDYNGDATLTGGPVSSGFGDIAFTNMPYVTNLGTSCGENFVNAGQPGLLDGVSIVEGHEYAETITDQNPAGGWTDTSGSESADKCAWNSGPGAPAANLVLPTGTFAMQSIWGNDGAGGTGACEFSHATVTNGGGGGGGGGIVNGGFETGTFTGWTTSGVATSIVTAGVHSGTHAARAGSTSAIAGSSNIGQTFTASGRTLAVWYDVHCTGGLNSNWATATLKDNTTGTNTTILSRTCVANSGWRLISRSLVSGQSYTLTLTNHDNGRRANTAYTLFDDISVS